MKTTKNKYCNTCGDLMDEDEINLYTCITCVNYTREQDALPTLMSLFGIAPELTADLNAVDLIRKMRDEW